MRAFCLRTWLAVAGTLLTQVSLAQRAPVELLRPTSVLVQPVSPAASLGQSGLPKPTSGAVLSQPAASATNHPQPIIPPPLMLVNARIIVSALATISSQDIADVVVYKGDNIPPGWRSATAGGVLNLVLKPGVKISSVSLAKLKRRQHLSGPVSFELNGRPLADTTLRVATHDVEALEVRPAVNEGAATVLNIKMSSRKPEPSKYPPGTIFIRGVAER